MKFALNNEKIPNGTVIIMGISYAGLVDDLDAQRGRTNPKVFTYVFLKAGGLWYGSGKAPQGAGWIAVNRWLDRDNRTVEWVKMASQWVDVYPFLGRDTSAGIDTLSAAE